MLFSVYYVVGCCCCCLVSVLLNSVDVVLFFVLLRLNLFVFAWLVLLFVSLVSFGLVDCLLLMFGYWFVYVVFWVFVDLVCLVVVYV